uniref:Uncharacterized protein n=1 Tax=Papio anubis TaxID=9555 RepID=A0A2I3LWR5_PAPAN
MRRIVFAGVILFCLLGDVGGLVCRACNLAIPFHGCLLDLGTCQAKPAQYCKKVVHIKGRVTEENAMEKERSRQMYWKENDRQTMERSRGTPRKMPCHQRAM